MRWEEHVSYMGEARNVYKLLVRKPEWRRPCGRCRHGGEGNNRIDRIDIGWIDVDCIHLT
jgi:hypothetical protein